MLRFRDYFERLATEVTRWSGSVWAGSAAFGFIAGWVAGGVLWFGFGDSYQLVVNTVTTVVTFLMVFLIQNSQNREMRAVHLKLDELIRAKREADDRFIGVEELTEDQLVELSARFRRLRRCQEGRGSGTS
jgi:low affinity Fe/Cu permease